MRIAVSRFDPASEARALSLFEVDLPPTMTVLDALLWIEEREDPTLAFRRMCRSGICGTCAGLVNGAPRLFCQMLLRDASALPVPRDVSADVLVEPLPQFRVLKDLIVDMEPFFEELTHVEAWLEPDIRYDGTVPPETMTALWPVACCVLCGICAERDVSPHPAAVARVLRFACDPRDAKRVARQETIQQFDEYHRMSLVRRLRAVCPAGVEIAPLFARAGQIDRSTE
jgi:succinate dehydrogenase / fumarate reductase, iron-sulfur subunit